MANEFKKAFKGIDQAIKQGTARALNRALSSAKTQSVKTIGQETGMKASTIKTRVLDIKGSVKKLSVQLAYAVKVGVSLAEFSPREKKVKVVHKGNTNPTLHKGVTVKISGNRQLVPRGFLWTAPSGKDLVIGRKNEGFRSKLMTFRTQAFRESVEKNKAETERGLKAKFEAEAAAQIDYAIQRKFDSNK